MAFLAAGGLWKAARKSAIHTDAGKENVVKWVSRAAYATRRESRFTPLHPGT